MMIEFKNNKVRMTLGVLGYSYPFSKDAWDANWLEIKITIKDYEHLIDFENSDACLTTMDIVTLKDWLTVIQKEDKVKIKTLSFMEPNISFEYDDACVLNIDLRYDFNPNMDYEKTPKENLGDSYRLSFKKSELDLLSVIKSLEISIKAFPQKGNPR